MLNCIDRGSGEPVVLPFEDGGDALEDAEAQGDLR